MTKRSVTYLKGHFETGDIPTQTDYADLIDSFVNLEASAAQSMAGKLELPAVSAQTVSANNVYVNNNLYKGSNLVVSAGVGTQAGATRLDKDICVVYGNAILGFGVVAATCEVGRVQHIINTSTTALTVFPASGCAFLGTAADTGSISLAINSTMTLVHVASATYAVTRGTI